MDVRDLILKQRQAVMNNINNSFGVSAPASIEKADDDELEKGKWQIGMTREWQGKTYKCTGFSPATNRPTWSLVKDGGKGDGDTDDSGNKKTATDKSVEDFMENVKKFNNKYTDPSKVSVVKTPKGNWDVSYDGHRLGIIGGYHLNEKTAKEQGWLKDEETDSSSSNDSTKSTPAVKKPDFTPKVPASILRLTSRSSDSDIRDAWILLGREIKGDSTLNNTDAFTAAISEVGLGRGRIYNTSKTAQIDAMKQYYVDKAKQEEKNWQAEQNKKYWSSAEGQKRKGEIEKEMSDLKSGLTKVKTDVENKIRSITNAPDLRVDISPRNMIVSVLDDNRYDVASMRVEENWNGDGYDNKFIMSSNNTDVNNSTEVGKLQKILTSVSSMIANSDKIKKEAIASFGEIKKIQKRAQELQDELDSDK